MTDDEGRPPTLADVVRDARGDMSYQDVADRSDGKLAKQTVWRIENTGRTKVTPRTLEGLARGLGVPISRLRAANGQTAAVPSQPFVLPDRAQGLTSKQRRLVLAVIDGLLDAGR